MRAVHIQREVLGRRGRGQKLYAEYRTDLLKCHLAAHSLCLEHGRRARPRKEFEQRFGGGGIGRRRGCGTREIDLVAQVSWQRSRDLDAMHRRNLTEQLEDELHAAGGAFLVPNHRRERLTPRGGAGTNRCGWPRVRASSGSLLVNLRDGDVSPSGHNKPISKATLLRNRGSVEVSLGAGSENSDHFLSGNSGHLPIVRPGPDNRRRFRLRRGKG